MRLNLSESKRDIIHRFLEVTVLDSIKQHVIPGTLAILDH